MSERPAALDGLLNHIAANIPDLPDEDAATAKARAAIAPLEAKIREAKAQERAEIRTAALLEGADAIDATFTGPDLDRYARYGADLLRRMASGAKQDGAQS